MSITRSRGLARKIFPLNATEIGQLTFANTLTYGAKLDWFDAITDSSSTGGAETLGKAGLPSAGHWYRLSGRGSG